MQNQKTDGLHPSVAEALQLFEGGTDLSKLSLEQIMMCVHHKPCVRISPSVLLDTRYGWGSVLVAGDKVTLVINPDDNTLYMPVASRKYRFIGPQRKFNSLLPGSRFYTYDTVTRVCEYEWVIGWRALQKHDRHSIPVGVVRMKENQFGGEETGMLSFRHHRCEEVYRLMGRRSGKKLRKALLES